MKKIFVVSSVEGRKQAQCFIKHCIAPGIEYRPWWSEFTGSRIMIDELERIKDEYHGALVVLTPDMQATHRGKRVRIPSQNVMFEWGFFLSKFNKAHIAVVRYGEVHIPSDLGGWILLHGSDVFNQDRVRVPNKRTKEDFHRWLNGALKRRTRSHQPRTNAIPAWKSYAGTREIPSAILQEEQGALSIWAFVERGSLERPSGSDWRYLLSHATNGEVSKVHGRFPNAWGICSVRKAEGGLGLHWRFFCNGESWDQTEMRYTKGVSDGWHLFTLTWSRAKNRIVFYIDKEHVDERPFVNWPLNYANEIHVGNWVIGTIQATPLRIGRILEAHALVGPSQLQRALSQGPE